MIKNLTVRLVLVAAAIITASVVPGRAQSLAAVAQQEAARRKAVKQPAKVFTNDSLQAVPSTAAPAPAGEAAAQPAEPAGAAPAEAAAVDKEPQAPDPARDQEYWRKLMTDALQARDRNAFLMEAVQSRINALTTDFYARDDPHQRAQLGVERQKTLDELENMKKDQAAFEKKIADIQEKARRANIPPGWLR
jgi:hypothetical protein